MSGTVLSARSSVIRQPCTTRDDSRIAIWMYSSSHAFLTWSEDRPNSLSMAFYWLSFVFWVCFMLHCSCQNKANKLNITTFIVLHLVGNASSSAVSVVSPLSGDFATYLQDKQHLGLGNFSIVEHKPIRVKYDLKCMSRWLLVKQVVDCHVS